MVNLSAWYCRVMHLLIREIMRRKDEEHETNNLAKKFKFIGLRDGISHLIKFISYTKSYFSSRIFFLT